MPVMRTIGEFMQASSRGSKKSYLKDWKRKEPFAITVWLSCLSPIVGRWSHGWLKVQPKEDKQTKEKTNEVWRDVLVCYELDEVNEQQRFREKGFPDAYGYSTAEREHPPQVCPHCMLTEWIRAQALSGKLDSKPGDQLWLVENGKPVSRPGDGLVRPLFRFPATDASKTRFLLAGGVVNLLSSEDLAPEIKKYMGMVSPQFGGPVYQKWLDDKPGITGQSSLSKLEWIFSVVDNNDPNAGVQIAIEPNLLGEKVQGAISDYAKTLVDAGIPAEKADPLRNPVAFRWEVNKAKGISWNEMYRAVANDKIRLSPAIEKLIKGTEPPKLEEFLDRFNLETHRARLERYGMIPLPLDQLFAPALKAKAEGRLQAKADQGAAVDRAVAAAEGTRVPEVGGGGGGGLAPGATPPEQRVEGAEYDAEGFELVPCDAPGGCGKAMRITATACPHCGTKYEVNGAQPAADKGHDPEPAGDAGEGEDDIPFIIPLLTVWGGCRRVRDYEVPTRHLPRV